MSRDPEPALLGLATAAAGIAFVVATPPGGDAPAHLYRTLLFDHGVYVWDALWYAGHYPFASYSLLYYPLASVFGNEPLAVAAVAASAALFAFLVIDEWGDAARWSARAFAVFSLSSLLAGTYSYATALAVLLATAWAVRRRRWLWGIVGAAVTLALSPLAFLFLLLLLAAIAAVARPRLREIAWPTAALLAIAAGQGAVLVAFPTPGRYPYPGWQLLLFLVVCALVLVVAIRPHWARLVVAFFALWALSNVVAFVVPSTVGSNVLRLRAAVFPLMLLAAGLAHFRPRLLVAGALAAGLAYSGGPQVAAAVALAQDRREAGAPFWEPATTYLTTHLRLGQRVEVVPTRAHWEAYWLPRAGFSLARGWYRQLDIAVNEVLYEEDLPATVYRSWLDRMAVRFVILPHTRLSAYGAEREARLVRSPALGLRTALRARDLTIYEVPQAVPLLTGPGRPTLTAIAPDRLAGWLPGPGVYRLRVRHTRYWRVVSGPICVARADDGMSLLRASAAGAFELVVRDRPHELIRALRSRSCDRRDQSSST